MASIETSTGVDFRTFYHVKSQAQQNIDACTAIAVSNAVEYRYRIMNDVQTVEGAFRPSSLFVYYNSRSDPDKSERLTLEMAMDAISKHGMVPERYYAFHPFHFNFRPPTFLYKIAKEPSIPLLVRKSLNERPKLVSSIKYSLKMGLPVICGVRLYDSWIRDSAVKPEIPVPDLAVEEYHGGHSLCLVGYNDEKAAFIALNSWGDQCGDRGYFLLPYEFVLKRELICDVWSVDLECQGTAKVMQKEMLAKV